MRDIYPTPVVSTSTTPAVTRWRDFDGNGIDDLALFRNGSWWVRYSDGTTTTFTFGSDSWPRTIPVAGDWDGDGVDGIGTYTAATATWTLRQTASAGAADAGTVGFGTPGATYPVVGDWNGDGVDSIGLKALQGTGWSLRNTNAGPVEVSFDYGLANDLPITWRVAV
ncbi:MAG: hypothetical protein QOH36_1711 [Actinomycetota bacterium]|nr:hypothetical protein [Actinomycetota bacterium]